MFKMLWWVWLMIMMGYWLMCVGVIILILFGWCYCCKLLVMLLLWILVI